MKKELSIVLVLLNVIFPVIAHGKNFIHKRDKANMVGATTLRDTTLKNGFEVTGSLNFENLEARKVALVIGAVTGRKGNFHVLEVTGPLTATEIKVKDLYVIGPVALENAAIGHITDITGPLDAKKSRFFDIHITSEKVTLTDCRVKRMTIRNSCGCRDQQ